MAETLTITPGHGAAYDVLIGRGMLDQAGVLIADRLGARRIILIADAAVYDIYGARVLAALDGYEVLTTRLLPSGEGAKSLPIWQESMEAILAAKPSRNDVVVALGGGVCGDHAGFVAATLLRGVDFIQIPTTLLAQVDSSIGGKTGVNASSGKNLIGAFHHPRLVISDLDTLDTLPERELRCGYAELLKHAVIDDLELFEMLERGSKATKAATAARPFGRPRRDGEESEPVVSEEMLHQSCQVKARIVAEDAMEKTGRRALLNFGHTFAHALEADMGYDGRLLHGEAVAMGMVMALHLSHSLGMIDSDQVARVINLFKAYDLRLDPGNLPFSDAKSLAGRMQGDKKAQAGRITFILLEDIGRAVTYDAPDMRLVHQAIEKGLSTL